jgi:hypothetical protein
MSFLNGIGAFGAGLGAFAGNAMKDLADTERKPLLNSTPAAPVVESTPPAAAAAPAPAPATAGATSNDGVALGMRQNNPGNLTFAGQPGATQGTGNRFASFPDMPTGVAATANQLALYQTEHGIDTVRDAVTRWVSDPKADLKSYIAHVAAAIGVAPDAKVDLTDPKVQAAFILAQQPHESGGGGAVLNPADVLKGVQMAAAARGSRVATNVGSGAT